MHLPFDSMPGHSRLWVYQANRPFAADEQTHLTKGLRSLCDDWSAHGSPLHTSFTLQYDQFVVLAVDERLHGASGCSIDGSVHFLKNLQQSLGLDFFDRSHVAFLQEKKVMLYDLPDLKRLFEKHTLSADSISFNNAVTTRDEWVRQWLQPVKDSWMARYLPKTAVA